MRKKIFLTIICTFVFLFLSMPKSLAADSDCSPGVFDSVSQRQNYTIPFPLKEDNLFGDVYEDKFFILKIKVVHKDREYKLDYIPYDVWMEDNNYKSPDPSGIVTFEIIVQDTNPSKPNVQNLIFTDFEAGKFKPELLVKEQTGDLYYCSVPITTIIAPSPTPFPTSTPKPPRCTIGVYPMNSVIQPLQDVTVRVLANDRTDLIYMQLQTSFQLLINKERNGINEPQTSLDFSKNVHDIKEEYEASGVAPPFEVFPTGRYYISQNIGGFPTGYKITARVLIKTLAPYLGGVILRDEYPCGSITFEVGKMPATPTPIKTPEEQEAAQEREKLKALCDIIPHDNLETEEKEPATEQQEAEYQSCVGCVNPTDPNKPSGSYTAIGCLPTNLPDFFTRYLWPYGLGIAGGIAFLLMLWGAFNILVSMGDPKRIEHGRELIVSAITGLLFIIFAVLILRIIGVDTLKIPGFS